MYGMAVRPTYLVNCKHIYGKISYYFVIYDNVKNKSRKESRMKFYKTIPLLKRNAEFC